MSTFFRHFVAILTTVSGSTVLGGQIAEAHDYFAETYAPAGRSQELTLLVPHGCKGSPVKEVHVKIPEGVSGVGVYFDRDWKIETKTRKMPPVQNAEGRAISETIDEIIWSNPSKPLPPSGFYDTFRFRAALPNTPNRVLWFKSFQVCEQGDDHYVEVPKQDFTADMPDFAAKLAAFHKSAKGPAPYIVLTKPKEP